jgi:hypothetical protein
MTAIVPGDILFYLSAPSASAGFTTAGTPGASWGGYISTSQLNAAVTLDNLFTDITGAENAAGQVDYACLFVLNNTSSGNSMLNTVAWLPLSGFVAGGANVALGADPAGVTVKTVTTLQAAKISTNTAAPAGVTTWVTPQSSAPPPPSYAGGLQVGTVPPGSCFALWIRRTATNSPPVNNDGLTVQVICDTMG